MCKVIIRELSTTLPEKRKAEKARNRLILERYAPAFVQMCKDLQKEGIDFGNVNCQVEVPDKELEEINRATGFML